MNNSKSSQDYEFTQIFMVYSISIRHYFWINSFISLKIIIIKLFVFFKAFSHFKNSILVIWLDFSKNKYTLETSN